MVVGRSVYRVDVLRDRGEAEINEAGTPLQIDENVFLGRVLCQSEILANTPHARLLNPRGRPRYCADS